MIGFSLSFIPMYIVGLMGATRRLDTYDASTGWQPFYVLMLIGGIIIAVGVALQIVQIIASVMQKRRLRDVTGDPWDGRSLEWATASVPAPYNFTTIPQVTSRDAFWKMKQQGLAKPKYEDIHMPRNTASGIYISIFAFLMGFGFVWHITWLAIVSIVGIVVCTITRTFNEDTETTITAAEVERSESARLKKLRDEHPTAPDKPTSADLDEDMGLREFIKLVVAGAWNIVRKRQWRTWQKH